MEIMRCRTETTSMQEKGVTVEVENLWKGLVYRTSHDEQEQGWIKFRRFKIQARRAGGVRAPSVSQDKFADERLRVSKKGGVTALEAPRREGTGGGAGVDAGEAGADRHVAPMAETGAEAGTRDEVGSLRV